MRRYRKKIENIEEIPLGYMNIIIKSLVPCCNIDTSNHTKRKIQRFYDKKILYIASIYIAFRSYKILR